MKTGLAGSVSFGDVQVDPGTHTVTRDGSVSAHFEHTVAVTAGEPWILTARDVPVSARR